MNLKFANGPFLVASLLPSYFLKLNQICVSGLSYLSLVVAGACSGAGRGPPGGSAAAGGMFHPKKPARFPRSETSDPETSPQTFASTWSLKDGRSAFPSWVNSRTGCSGVSQQSSQPPVTQQHTSPSTRTRYSSLQELSTQPDNRVLCKLTQRTQAFRGHSPHMLESRYDLIRQIFMINIVHSLAMNSITLSKELSRDVQEGQGLKAEPGSGMNFCSPGLKTPTFILNIFFLLHQEIN